jgi:hypothetical protein
MIGPTTLSTTELLADTVGFGWFAPTLAVHVVAGVVALLAGLAAIATTKGGPRHNRAGKVYGVSMAAVVLTAVPLSVGTSNWFLFAISVFTGYLVAAGYRIVARRRARLTDPTRTDDAFHGTMIVTSLGMIAGGGYGSVAGEMALGEVLVVFGVVGGALALRELRELRRPTNERAPWFGRHIAFMGGAYISTVTATITVNLTMLPAPARWLGPTAVGVPLIFYAIRRYRPRFGRATA